VIVEPTLSGAWYAHSQEHYVEVLATEIRSLLSKHRDCLPYSQLSSLVRVPPPIATSLRVFLRKYPEHFYLHTDTTTGEVGVHRPFRCVGYDSL
jgi:hypothetical protein